MAGKHVIYSGPHTLDFTPIEGKVVDVDEGEMQGLRPDMPGFPSIVSLLADTMPKHGAAAGVSQELYDHFVMCNQVVAKVDELLPTAEKQIEVLRETRAFYVDARQNDISMMIDVMKSMAQRRKDSSVLAPFESMLKYNRQHAEKAVRTRRKNREAKLEGPEMAATPAPPAAPGAPEAPEAPAKVPV